MYIFTKTLDTYQEKSVLLEDMLMGEENLYGKKIIQNVTIFKSKQVCFLRKGNK